MWTLPSVMCAATSVFEGTTSFVNAIFRFNYLLGSLIMKAATGVYRHAAETCIALYTGVAYAFYDLLHFVYELYSLIFSVSDVVELLARGVVDSAYYACYGVQHGVHFLWGLACDIVRTLTGGAMTIVIVVSYLCSLLLRSGLLLLELPPRLLRQAGDWTYTGICAICHQLMSFVTSISGLTVAAVLKAVRDVWRTLFFQPGDVYIGLCMLLAFAACLKLWSRWGRDWLRCRQRHWRRRAPCEKKQQPAQQVTQQETCVVCQDAPRSVLLLPCRHFSLCEDCTRILLEEGHDCPICRHPIYEALTVFS